MSVGLEAEVGGTGDSDAEADEHSTISPALFFGKGFGDLPESSWLARPLALTGFFGGNVPTEGRTVVLTVGEDGEVEEEIEDNPTTLGWGFTVQYNLNYLAEPCAGRGPSRTPGPHGPAGGARARDLHQR